jgi:carbonic anhydrase
VTVVHTAKDKSTAKFSILFKEESGDFPDLFDNWILDAKKGAIQTFPFDGITPPSVYHYQGSETVSDSGDCAEGVEWFVSAAILPIK